MKDKILLTKEGLEKLKKEYRELVEIRRPHLVERISSARAQGDLAENSEYTHAREELSFMDGRIGELEKIINGAITMDDNHQCCQEVKLGCRVTVSLGDNQKIFHLVGEWEADPAKAKISGQSPLGQSLLGKKVGDKVEIEAPAGKIIYTVLKICDN